MDYMEDDSLLEGVDEAKLAALEDDDLLDGIDEAQMEAVSDELPSKLESLGSGVAEGATLGFADELGGMTQATLDSLAKYIPGMESVTDVNKQLAEQGFTGSGVGPQNSMELYKEGQLETKADLDKAAEANPLTNLTGQLVGGLSTGALLPGGVAAEAATASGRIANAAKAGATVGAEYGLLQGVGDSEADITGQAGDYLKQIGSDALEGATAGGVTGGVLGGGLKAVGEAGSWLNKWLRSHKSTGHMMEAFDAGKRGYQIKPTSYTEEINPNRPSYTMEKDLAVEDLANKIHRTDRMLAKKVGDTLDAAEAKGTIIKVDKELEKAIKDMSELEKNFMSETGEKAIIGLDDILARTKEASKMSKDAVQSIVDAVERGELPSEAARDLIAARNGGLSPRAAKDVLDEVQTLIDYYSGKVRAGTATKRAVDQLKTFRTMLRTKLGNEVEGYNNAAARFDQFRTNMPEKLLSKKRLRSNNPKLKDINRNNIHNRIQDVIEDTAESIAIGDMGEDGVRKVTDVKHYLDQMRQREGKNDILESLGYESGTDFADEMDKLQKMTGAAIKSKAANPLDPNRSTTLGSGVVDFMLSKGQGLNYRALNAAGRATQLPTVKKAGSLYNASAKALKTAIDKLSSSEVKGLSNLGKALEKSIAEGNQTKKNAVIFAILQRPDARKALGYKLNDED